MQQAISIRDYFTRPMVARLSLEENTIRENVMQAMIASRNAYPLADAPNREILQNLAERNILALAGDAVVAAYPVSGLATNKRVIFADGREAYAMCAIDALGFHYAFGEDIRIESECESCGEKIVLAMHAGRIDVLEGGNDIHVLHTDLENNHNWSCSCCNLMHFFSCSEQLNTWQSAHGHEQKTFALDLETANKVAWLLFAR
ncbi:alkylmercury lyase family protein [Neisseria montereyensis]|uniref:Alkylmercury lyase family protein n=1 Tax=Neisseria montereyensis TaxID=2973938 RepID=A0ABT2FB58_9NEIS|nr:alkylmercury lyase family protein [Neisseria montereyensis]MCS4533424.1 alkylmercury lyase family protein [Neisseria montereyensis]